MSGNVVVGYRTDATTSGIAVDVTPATPLPVTLTSGSTDQDVNIVQVGGVAIALGQAAMAASLPVVLASNQSTVPVAETPSSASAQGIAPVVSAALETGHVIKNSAGNLYGINCMSTTVAGIFLVHNTTAVPAVGAVTPIRAYPVAAGQAIDISFNPPLRCGTGISISFTSAATPFTQTDSATAFISGQAV